MFHSSNLFHNTTPNTISFNNIVIKFDFLIDIRPMEFPYLSRFYLNAVSLVDVKYQ